MSVFSASHRFDGLWLQIGVIAALALGCVAPVHAEVTEQGENGFAIVAAARAPVTADAAWKVLIAPNQWWGAEHSFTGDSENLYLDPQAGGCFCERIREKAADGKFVNIGSVEHMHVVFAERAKALRLTGALGPLQAEGVAASLTIGLKQHGETTQISFAYVVGGYARQGMGKLATALDGVIVYQLGRLAKALGGAGEKPAASMDGVVDVVRAATDAIPEQGEAAAEIGVSESGAMSDGAKSAEPAVP